MSYTVHRRDDFDQRVQQDLDLIRARLLEQFGDSIEALILVGAFGRGEGTVLVHGGEPRSVNDYDLVIVAKEALPQETISRLARDLANELGLSRVDLFPYRRAQLAAFRPSVFGVELKLASQVIYGDPSVLDSVPAMDPARIPIEEARRLVFGHLACLLEAVEEADFHRQPEGESAFRIAYQASKVILASVEALLIEAGEYHPTCREREGRFLKRFKKYEHLCGLVRTATHIKLNAPEASFDVIRYWLWARRFYLAVLFHIVCRSYETPLADWWDLSGFYHSPLRFMMKKAWYRIFDRLEYERVVATQKRMQLELAEIFLQLARESRERVRGPYMAAARELLVTVTGEAAPMDWEEARIRALQWDHRIVHPH